MKKVQNKNNLQSKSLDILKIDILGGYEKNKEIEIPYPQILCSINNEEIIHFGTKEIKKNNNNQKYLTYIYYGEKLQNDEEHLNKKYVNEHSESKNTSKEKIGYLKKFYDLNKKNIKFEYKVFDDNQKLKEEIYFDTDKSFKYKSYSKENSPENKLVIKKFKVKKKIEQYFEVNGVKKGTVVCVYLNEKEVEIYNYINGIKEGKAILCHPNGVKEEYIYLNGVRQESEKFYYPDQRVEEIIYNNDVKQIKEKFFDNGRITKEIIYFDEKKQVKKQTEFYENGKIHKISNYKNDKLDGEYILYNEKRTISEKCFYEGGKLNGEYIYYYDDGKIHKILNYKNDKLDGEYLEIDILGDRIKCFYKDGKLNGQYIKTSYTGKGKKREEISRDEYFYENGKKVYEKSYLGGKLFREKYCYENENDEDDDDYDFSLAGKILKATGKLAGKAVIGIGKAFVEEYKKNL